MTIERERDIAVAALEEIERKPIDAGPFARYALIKVKQERAMQGLVDQEQAHANSRNCSSCGAGHFNTGFAHFDGCKVQQANRDQQIRDQAAIAYQVEKLREANRYELLVLKCKAMIENGIKPDWPFTDVFDDGGIAWREAARRIGAEKDKPCAT